MKKKIIFITLSIFIIISLLFSINNKDNKIYSDQIDNSNINDLAFYVQTEEGSEEYNSIGTIPSKNDGYIFKEAICNDNSTVSFDNINWSIKISNIENSKVRCKLYFDIYNTPAKDYILSLNTVNESTPDFSKTATTDEGIFMAEDDYGISYYWRGDVENNYFYFAGYYWRIVRINGDGSIRLIYQGTNANATGSDANALSLAWNTNYNDNAYVGYMYGTPKSSTYEATHANFNNSTLKTGLDSWYESNLINYSNYLADSGFCGDRSLTSGNGIGTNLTYYGSYGRIVTNKNPSFKCINTEDLYTLKSSSKGNKALDYPIGLITADEVAYAGGVSSGESGTNNTSYYLNTGTTWRTMTPYGYNSQGNEYYASVYGVDASGVVRRFYGSAGSHGVRPVINLKADTVFTGTGTSADPFVVA